MFLKTMKRVLKSGLVASAMTGAVFLLPAENAFAVASLTLSTAHAPIDSARAVNTMDSAGTWNGTSEATDTTGDTFTFTIQNSATGAVNVDSAFDINITVSVPSGFRLPQASMLVNANVTAGSCSNFSVNATQAGGVGSLVNFNIPSNTDIAPGCSYDFTLGLTTDDATPFAPAGLQSVVFNLSYNQIDNNSGSQQNPSSARTVTVNAINLGDLSVVKTARAAVASNGQAVIFDVRITNQGSGGMFNVELTDILSANLINLNIVAPSPPPGTAGPGSNQYTFEYLAAGEFVDVVINSTAFVDPTSTTCPVMTNDAPVVERSGVSASDFAQVDFNLTNSLQLSHDLVNSYCELCGVGTVRLTAQNIGGISLTNITIKENLGVSGLTFIPGSVFISVDGGPLQAAANPIADPADPTNLQRFIWNASLISDLTQLDSPFAVSPVNPISIEFVFNVRRITGLSNEDLSTAIRNIQPTADYDLICNSIAQSTIGTLVELPIRQPHPQVTKLGRNTDAGSGAGDYATLVSGHIDDGIIWRVEIQNTGQANLLDLEIDDVVGGGNFDINWVCNSEGAASNATAFISGAATPAGCVSASGGNFASFVADLDVDDSIAGVSGFGNPNNDEPTTFIDVATASSAFIYYVGRIQSFCSLNSTNTSDIEWGCEANGENVPAGGITAPATNGGLPPAVNLLSLATFNAQVNTAGFDVQQNVSGINTSQPVGSSGLVTIQITNNTGATVRDLVIQDVLPVGQYVVDSTFTPSAVVTPVFGAAYAGMIDTISSDIDTTPANLLLNTQPTFTLTSSTQRAVNTVAGDDRNLLRNGDILTVQFRIILIETSRYDLAADINLAPEVQAGNTDPTSDFTITNQVIVDYSNICNPVNSPQVTNNQNFAVDVEDLDIDISDALFILTNDTTTPLTLNVLLTNNGGHDADNHATYVTFGQAMTVQVVAAGCAITTNPPAHPLWDQPAFLPATATVYLCDRGVLAPGVTQTFSFDVIKNTVGSPVDDLTFRADVVGEVTLSDGTALTLPAPATVANTTPDLQIANNYTLDGIRSRVLGFNLTQTAWYCTESGTTEPTAPIQSSDLASIVLPTELNTQIGEDCHYFIESGGWFGFLTPGFDLIAVRDITVTAGMEGVPAGNGGQGLGLIPFAAGNVYDFHGTNQDVPVNSTPDVIFNSANGGAGVTSLNQSPISWTFNDGVNQDITEKDKFFRVNYKARLLNDDVDLIYPVPGGFSQNLHSRISTNIVTTSFHAIFEDTVSGINIDLTVDETTPFPGYPDELNRQVNLTDVGPNLLIVKTVCNETVTGTVEDHRPASLSSCSSYSNSLTDGDTNDSYVYRIAITNQSPTTPARSPAYEISVRDVLDSSDLMLIEDFATDNLDNDDDGVLDGGDANEGVITTDNILNNANPAEIEFDFADINVATATVNKSLLRIDAGQTVNLYYRVNPSDSIAPLQPLTNVVSTTYDSLEGDFGNQNSPQLLNTESTVPNNTGRARIYTAIDANAVVQMLPLQSIPKIVIDTSHTTLSTDPAPQNQSVVVGEEVRYELRATLPVADLDNFKITDELPLGVRCVSTNYPTLTLSAVTFSPGGTFTPVCTQATPGSTTHDVIVWDFNNQEVIAGPSTGVDFRVDFVARIENTTQTVDPDPTVNDVAANECVLVNGGSTGALPSAAAVCSTAQTVARLTYTETFSAGGASTDVTVNYGEQRLFLREPSVAITKVLSETSADAQDEITVTVSIVNNGNSPAYNVQVLDDLSATKFNYVVGSQSIVGLPAGPPTPSLPDNVDLSLSNDQPVFNWDNVALAGYQLDPGESIVFSFKVEVDDITSPQILADPHVVEPHDVIANTLDVRWTSLPVNTVALNVTGSIGADGSSLGMRNGALPAANVAPNNYDNTSNTPLVTVPALSFTKTDLNPPAPPQPETVTIGEHKQFELVLGLPEGITNSISVVDDLATTGSSYVLQSEVGFPITYSFAGIFSINNTTTIAAASFTSVPADEASGSSNATWNIGAVDTTSEDDVLVNAIDPSITINYFARVDNSVAINAGDTLQNSANLTYNNVNPAGGFTRTTALQTVVEPHLQVLKSVENLTKPLVTDRPDAGDILRYTVLVSFDASANQSSAFDINIQDNIPAGIVFNAGSATITVGGSSLGNLVPLINGGGALIWGRTNTTAPTTDGDDALDLIYDQVAGSGQQLTLVYSVTVQDTVEPNEDLDGNVVVDWTSLQTVLPAVDPLERNGPGGTSCNIIDQNDYCVADGEPLLVTDASFITKTADNDTFNDVTNSTANDQILRIGDTVEYTLTLSLQEGLNSNVQLVDVLPPGLQFNGIVSINGDTSADYTSPGAPFSYSTITAASIVVAANTPGADQTQISWNLGSITNVGQSGVNDGNNDFVIVYTAQVIDGVLAQTPSISLLNLLDFNYTQSGGGALQQSDSASISALQPQILLADIVKQRYASSAYSGTLIPSGSPAASGATVFYRLQACNSGAAPAYDVVIVDDLDPVPGVVIGVLPNEFDLTTVSVPVVRVNGVSVTAGVAYTYNIIGSVMTFNFNAVAVNPANSCIEIDYNVQVDAGLAGGNSWDNSFLVDSYASINAADPNAVIVGQRQVYATDVGPILFNQHNINPIENPSKAFTAITRPDINPPPLTARDATLAAVGELITYQIIVPDTGMNGTMHDVQVIDDLDSSLVFESAQLVSASSTDYGFDLPATETITLSGIGTQNVRIRLNGDLIGLERATINVVARVANNSNANIATTAFDNTVRFEFANSNGGSVILGGSGTTNGANNISIVEPQLSSAPAPSIQVRNLTKPSATDPPDAGDILEYTISYGFLGGAANDSFSDAYDISITSDIGPGLVYLGSATSSINPGSVTAPSVSGNILVWDSATNTADIDVPEGGTATFTYQLEVRDSVLATQTLSNNTVIRWSSLDDDINNINEINERDGAGGINTYFSGNLVAVVTTTNTNSFSKVYLSDTSPQLNVANIASDVRVGDVIDYRITLSLQEGTSAGVQLQDVLPVGLSFGEIISINGDTTAPYSAGGGFSYTDIASSAIALEVDTPLTGQTRLTWTLGDIVNAGNTGAADGNNDFIIEYRVRVKDKQPTVIANPSSNIVRQNNINFNFGITDPVTPTPQTQSDSASVTVQQPNLAVAKTSTQQFTDATLIAGEVVTYTITITNNGLSPAYDVLLQDTLPAGLRVSGITVSSITVGGVGVPVQNPTSYDANTGLAIWDFDNSNPVYAIPANAGTMVLVFTVTADASIGTGLSNLQNSAVVNRYYSFDDDLLPSTGTITGVREIYGPSNTILSTPPLGTPLPSPLEKANQIPTTNLNRSIGIPFDYIISVPETTSQSTALYDVRVLDNLGSLAPNVELIVVGIQKISGSGSWSPVNTNTGLDMNTNLIIGDLATGPGIDIPANEQAVIRLSVVLRNSSNNVVGDVFTNQADYTFNSLDNDNASQSVGGSGSDAALTIVEPSSMTLLKTGSAGTGAPGNRVVMQFGVAETFTLNVQNIGTGPAYDLTITDLLSNPVSPLTGGMCDNAPTIVSAQVFAADGVTPVSIPLIENTHFTTTYNGPPTCTFTITTTAPEAELQPLNRLIFTYNAVLDVDNVNNAIIRNIAGVTRWFSADTPAGIVTGEIREYNEVITIAAPGTPGTLDHEDVAEIQIAAPQLVIEKRAFNPVTGAPAFTAEPDESVRYQISITNIGPVAANNFSLTDEADRLNGTGYFVPGSMANINVSLAGVDISNTDINAGNNAAGILDVRNMNLSNLVTGNNSLTIDFNMTLQGVIDSGTFVDNQALVTLAGFNTLLSDDPDLSGATNPTRIIIGSIPTFRLLKTSTDITGAPNVLDASDILRYTITAQNIGAENSINTLLRDQIPANTSYVANTTTLNGASVADAATGVSPLQNGLLINAPEDITTGAMRADSTSTTNIATVTFDVQINPNVVNSTVLSNQAFVGGNGVGSGPYSEQPSDDPRTEIIGDPTRDVVGNVAIIDAQKTVELIIDNGVVDQVDPGDTLRYSITISNSGTVAATDVVLQDTLPLNTSYVTNSTSMNGLAVADVAASLPLITGLAVSSSDVTPPLPAANAGTVNPQQAVTIVFDVSVNSGTANGVVIRNQGLVTSAEFPDELTDADGNDINGDQPTDIIVGNTQQLTISKEVFVVGGGTAQPGATLEYFISVENTGPSDIDLATSGSEVLKLFDDVDKANLISYVQGSARLNGVVDPNVNYSAPRLIVEYDLSKQAISPNFMFERGDKFTLRYLVKIDAAAVQGTDIVNTVAIDWGTANFLPVNNTTLINCSGGTQNVDACSSVSLAVGGAPGVATLGGSLWHDASLDKIQDANERVLAGWEVEIYFGAGSINPGDYLDSVFTDVDGNYTIQGLVANDGDALKYALRFRPPGASTDTASLGTTISPFFSGNGPQTLSFFEVQQSSFTPDISLPIQPNGVTYDSVLRSPVSGTVLQLTNSTGVELPASCFVDPTQQNQRSVADGYYKFELNFSQAECVAGADYIINVFPPAGYFDGDNNPATPNISAIIPPALSITGPAFDAVSCVNDPFATVECEVQASELAPPVDITPRTALTNYYQKFSFNSGPGDNQVFNNHIALDPLLDNAISISKISALVNVTRGQLVPYTITLSNNLAAPIYDLDLTDLFPSGFKYIAGSGRMQTDNEPWVKTEPIYSEGLAAIPLTSVNQFIDLNDVTGVEDINEFIDIARVLSWNNIDILRPNSTISLKLLLVVGSGVGEGEYINRAIATNNQTAGAASGIASATVRVIPDPTFDCSDVIGKVFDDKNLNAYQDEGEEGIAGIRVLTARGLEITTDAHGRFHLTCAVVPNPDRGSNFIIKLDERSLPSGYRLTTENPRVVRATRGKMIKFNFGAAIHRVVRLDMADAVFEPKTTKMRPQWLPRLDILITELAKDPSLLRLSYLADNETPDEVDDRLNAVKDEIEKRWQELNCCYQLSIETEVFWRKGGPVNREEFND